MTEVLPYLQPLADRNFVSQTSRTNSRIFIRFSAAEVGFFLLLVVSVFCCCAVSADVAPKRIVAYENETVTLPCQTSRSGDFLTVEWSKDGIIPNITLLYRHGRETVEEKNPAFLNRTTLTLKEVKSGNISQVISKLRLSDGGRYECRTMVGKQLKTEATLELIVGAVSEPKLNFVPAGPNGGLTLECRAERWFPEPNITFHDKKGDEIKAEDPRRVQNSAGCFTVTRRVSLQSVTNSVTCSVHQPLLNHRRNVPIYIPDNCMRSCHVLIVGIVLGVICVLGLCAITVIWKKSGCTFPVSRQKPAQVQRVANGTQTEHDQNTKLEQKNKDLTSDILKDELISKLQAEIEDLKSKSSDVQQQGLPTAHPGSSLNGSQQVNRLDGSNTPPAATSANHNPESHSVSKVKVSEPAGPRQQTLPVPQKKNKSKSTSAISTEHSVASSGSFSASTSKNSNIPRSVSFSGLRPAAAKPSRRHTMSNPFSVLADLTEESEYLITENSNQNH